MRVLVKDWEELAKIPNESSTHRLEIDAKRCHGWIISKDPKPYKGNLSFMRQIKHQNVYLSTHTFYRSNFEHSGKMLRACGFDVEIDNWDKE